MAGAVHVIGCACIAFGNKAARAAADTAADFDPDNADRCRHVDVARRIIREAVIGPLAADNGDIHHAALNGDAHILGIVVLAAVIGANVTAGAG